MATALTVTPVDRGVIVVTMAFTDAGGTATVPNSITWTLTDRYGTVINEREDVTVATPAASVSVTLSGDDLDHNDGAFRRFIVDAEYDSTEGSGLPLRGMAYFPIEDIDKVEPA